MDGPGIKADGEGAHTRSSASRVCRRSFSALSSKKVLSLEDEQVRQEGGDSMMRASHGSVATWIGLCDGEEASRSQLVLDEVGIALYFKEDLGLWDVVRGDGRPGSEANVGIHLLESAERLVKGDMEGTMVFRWR